MNISERLFAMQDLRYRDFQCRLMPTVNPANVIGVRTPQLRRFASEIARTPEAETFLRSLPHRYYDENNLHAFLIERIRDYDACIAALNAFLPHVDNWATCDGMNPKVLGKHLTELEKQIAIWLASDHAYTVRYGVKKLMDFYLDAAFSPEYPAMVAAVRSEEYYVNMMIAWYFATALAKQWDAVLPFIAEERLSPWCRGKAIQKAIESDRISPEQKAILRSVRRK